MKKYFLTLAAVIGFEMISLVLTSCSKDDSTPAVELTYSVNLDGSGFDLVDKSVTYIDENGQEKTESFSGNTWNKTITVRNFPCYLWVQTNYKRNEVAISADSKYEFSGEIAVRNFTIISPDGTRRKLTKHALTCAGGEDIEDSYDFSLTVLAWRINEYIDIINRMHSIIGANIHSADVLE